MYRRIYSTEALVINDLRSPSNKFDGTIFPSYFLIITKDGKKILGAWIILDLLLKVLAGNTPQYSHNFTVECRIYKVDFRTIFSFGMVYCFLFKWLNRVSAACVPISKAGWVIVVRGGLSRGAVSRLA